MDPNEALKNARAALAMIRARPISTEDGAYEQFTDAFEALDGWLSKGGFLPDAWELESSTPKDAESAPWTDQG